MTPETPETTPADLFPDFPPVPEVPYAELPDPHVPLAELERLDSILTRARVERFADVSRLAGFNADELAYLSRLGELEDPDTDGLECVRGEEVHP